ncbi:MAG: FAD-dependent oxidoreductase [Exiguobacterium profundum]|nr:MAG: FAD-dependent oxidoreductase [Exiguobacterium profundum]
MILINIWDVAQDELTDDRLKAVLGFDATLGAWMGPRSPNSLILLLNRLAGEVNGQKAALAWARGGMGSAAEAMAKAVAARGVTVLRDARVEGLVFEAEQVAGVRLSGGEVMHAGVVVSAISPKTTLLQLAGPRHLDTGLINDVRHQKSRGLRPSCIWR